MASDSLWRKIVFCRECNWAGKVVQVIRAKAHNEKSRSLQFFNGLVPFHVMGQTVWHLIKKAREYDLFKEYKQNWKAREKVMLCPRGSKEATLSGSLMAFALWSRNIAL